MLTAVFLGPTLSIGYTRRFARAGLHFQPPAQRGDITLAAKAGVQVVGLIDGRFGSVPSVLHKEILWAISRGCRVLGASSLGALRAAELSRYGMVGIGRIYEEYASGRIWADDEVALVHGPAEMGFIPTTDP